MQDDLKEIIEAAQAACGPSTDSERRTIEATYQRWMTGKTRELEDMVGGRPLTDLRADEARRYAAITSSIATATIAVSNMHQVAHQVLAKKERLVGSATSDATRPTPAYVPPSLREYRDREMRGLRIGDDAAGGIWVHDQVGEVVEYLRPSSIVLKMNPRVFTMASDALELPKLAGSTTVFPSGEIGAIAASDVSTGAVRLQSHAYGVRTIGSLDWFDDISVAARELLGRDMALQLALKFDFDCLQGDGTSGKPIVGMRHMPGVTQTEVASGAGNGGAPALVDIINAIDRLERDNAVPSFIAMHPRTWGTFRRLDDLQERLQLTPDPSQDAARRLFGLPVLLSSQISITETQGSNADCSYILVGDGSQLAVGIRTQNILLYDPYSFASTRQVQIIRHSRLAFNVLNTEAVEVIEGVRAV